MAQKTQFYGIKYPFTDDGTEKYMFDVNAKKAEQAKSEVMHLLLTPKGERIMKPDFGTDLMKYVFDQNDKATWSNVETEIRSAATRWLKGINITSVEVLSGTKRNEEEGVETYSKEDIFVRAKFTLDLGYKTTEEEVTTKI